jgi:hypothetical protein
MQLAALAGSMLASRPSNDDIVKIYDYECRITSHNIALKQGSLEREMGGERERKGRWLG